MKMKQIGPGLHIPTAQPPPPPPHPQAPRSMAVDVFYIRGEIIALKLLYETKYPLVWTNSGTSALRFVHTGGRQRQRKINIFPFMNGSNGIQWGCSHWGGINGNGKSDVDGNIMEWVGYPFATATAMAKANWGGVNIYVHCCCHCRCR